MRKMFLASLLSIVFLTAPIVVFAEQQPEMILEKMAVKLTRGLANTTTAFLEFPKQTILSIEEMGPVGIVVGPLKGIGMTLYRGFIGATETIFFPVPQPGYYDSTIDPAYVWEGWEPKREYKAPDQ
jgi:putative exosortase-associated protein (TIGR04073 family)